ncbi:MAG: uroporphyrinogen-III synthase [Gammaproteobacteria bacterium]|nr:uroporphyrinogen-III synthase [Gammaproteobacteria bacterium]MCB1905050.1 uroporphyrinogen-III synthase [Gammaproteobacteria bacterium]
MADCNLAGAGVLVTRAAHQADGLCKLIAEVEGRPLPLPALEISSPRQTGPLRRLLADIERFDMAIFVSVNAVHWGLNYLSGRQLPEIRIAAVGRATAHALTASGHSVAVVPRQGFDSEALLAAAELSAAAVTGKRIIIFRGEGGRELLGETLSRRGALVEYAEVYRRSCPAPVGDLGRASWINHLDVVTATSNAILDNLFTLFGAAQRERLQRTPLVVISKRMRDYAHTLGCQQVVVAAGPDDRAIVEAICSWISGK